MLLTRPGLRHTLPLACDSLTLGAAVRVHLEPFTDRDTFAALIQHGLTAVGAAEKILADPALELLARASGGVPRTASKILRAALRLAHEREQRFVDEHLLEDAIEDVLAPIQS